MSYHPRCTNWYRYVTSLEQTEFPLPAGDRRVESALPACSGQKRPYANTFALPARCAP